MASLYAMVAEYQSKIRINPSWGQSKQVEFFAHSRVYNEASLTLLLECLEGCCDNQQ